MQHHALDRGSAVCARAGWIATKAEADAVSTPHQLLSEAERLFLGRAVEIMLADEKDREGIWDPRAGRGAPIAFRCHAERSPGQGTCVMQKAVISARASALPEGR